MEEKKDDIFLDALLLNRIDCAAFEARLANGHTLIAWYKPVEQAHFDELVTGQRVRVSLSPFDMSKGQVLEVAGA